jgi:hypothetical protein
MSNIKESLIKFHRQLLADDPTQQDLKQIADELEKLPITNNIEAVKGYLRLFVYDVYPNVIQDERNAKVCTQLIKVVEQEELSLKSKNNPGNKHTK